MDVAMIAKVAVALALVFVLMQVLNAIRLLLGAKSGALPADLNFSDREAVKNAVGKITGGGQMEKRLRSLLTAWLSGGSRGDVVQLAGVHAGRAEAQARGALFFAVLLLLVGAITPNEFQKFAGLGLGLAGLMHFVQLFALGKIDAAIEAALLDRLPGQIEGTAITADSLADKLGDAIEKAFRNYIPQPDKLAAAATGAVEASMKNSSASLDALHKRLLDVQEALAVKILALQKDSATAVEAAQKKQLEINEAVAAKWTAGQKEAIASIEAAHKKFNEAQQAMADKQAGSQKETIASIEAAHKKFNEAQQAMADKQAGSQKESIAGIEAAHKKFNEAQQAMADKQSGNQKEIVLSLEAAKKAMDGVAQQLQTNLSGAADKWQAALQAHAQQMTQASQTIAAQLEKIQEVGKEIDKVLHIQQTVDNTIRSVTTTEDFRNTLATLKSHLEKSDNLLREVTKPRTIRLVESESAAK